jgi:hypothetical protein
MQMLHRIRLFCDVPRKAIERATGVSEHRLAKFEAGRTTLNDVEEHAVVSFLRARLKMIAEEEHDIPNNTAADQINRLSSRLQRATKSSYIARTGGMANTTNPPDFK